ncbi:MAG: aminotransferase class V-fold PLP-dependent enzyme [Candidatus Paceibacterota bacterium]
MITQTTDILQMLLLSYFNSKFSPNTKKSYFLGELELDKKIAMAKGTRYRSWATIAPNWYANTAISRPHMEFVNKPKKTYQKLVKLISATTQKNLREIDKIYREKITSCVEIIRDIFNEPDANVIFESNGTMALAFIRALSGAEGQKVISTSDMGRIAGLALQGQDTSIAKEDFKQQIGLFSPSGKLDKIIHSQYFEVDLYNEDRPKTIDQICIELFETVKQEKPKLVIVPQVSRTGIKLPVEKIGRFIKQINRQQGLSIFFAVDGAQAIGRSNSEDLKKPLKYCDAYFFVGQKALGSMTLAAIMVKSDFVKNNAKSLINSSITPRLCCYKFFELPTEIKSFMQKRGGNFAISLPEIESLDLSLRAFYQRGEGGTFKERRKYQISRTIKINSFIVSELSKIRGIKVFTTTEDTPLSPSIIIFTVIEGNGVGAETLRQKLQELHSPITFAPIYQRPILRIGLSELREQDINYLITSIKKIVHCKK